MADGYTGDGSLQADIPALCSRLSLARTQGELGALIAPLILSCPPCDLHRLIQNFSRQISGVDPGYRERVTEKIAEHLLGTHHRIRLMSQQGTLLHLPEPVDSSAPRFWEMVAGECRRPAQEGEPQLRFLKYLLAAFPMFVLGEPAHTPGTPFPGGDTVEYLQGVYYCPVREKANDVGGALCPFCPAVQTPPIGYLRPALHPGERRKQEFIRNCYDFHNFNG